MRLLRRVIDFIRYLAGGRSEHVEDPIVDDQLDAMLDEDEIDATGL